MARTYRLRAYMTRIRVTRRYFDARPDAPDSAIRAELPRHPVFLLTPDGAVRSSGGG